jgi:hypothetical protein
VLDAHGLLSLRISIQSDSLGVALDQLIKSSWSILGMPTDEKKGQNRAAPESREQVALRRTIARAFWRSAWIEANPKASADDEKAAWNEVRAQYMKSAKASLNWLDRRGIKFVKSDAKL